MTAMAPTPSRHVVSRTVAAAQSRVASVSESSLWSMSPGETAETLVELGRLAEMVAELELRVAEHAHGLRLGEGCGATSTAFTMTKLPGGKVAFHRRPQADREHGSPWHAALEERYDATTRPITSKGPSPGQT